MFDTLNILFMNSNDLLKKATVSYDNGNYGWGDKLLRRAYSKIAKGQTVYPVETFVRLPLYLQKAKLSQEAWEEFKSLLDFGYPNQTKDKELVPMEHSIIYDKMRLFLHREGENAKAVTYGILSFVSKKLGFYRQKRDEEFNNYISPENTQKILVNLLQKANREECYDDVLKIAKKSLNEISLLDFNNTENELNNLLISTKQEAINRRIY